MRHLLFFVAFLSFVLAEPRHLLAQMANVDGAKNEGEIVLYTSTRTEDANQLMRAFGQKYPFLKPNYYRAGSDPLFQRILTESRANQNLYDVISIKGPIIISLKQRGLLASYKSPERSAYAPGFYDPEGFWTDTYDLYYTIAYNTKMISPASVPKTWQDLLLPRWKNGKICMDPRLNDWFAGMMDVLGEKNGRLFMERLRSQNPTFRQGNALISQLLAAGEFPLAITYAHTVEQLRTSSAPIDWVSLEPMIAISQPIALSARAPHPNAGKLLIDFMLSAQGANLLKLQKRIPARLDVEPVTERLNPKRLKLHPVNIAVEKLDPTGFRKFFRLQ